jgi:hypothetical protein
VASVPLDAQERVALCDLFDELGASVPTLLGPAEAVTAVRGTHFGM